VAPDLVVIHYTVLGLEETLARLCDPVAEVSAHYVIAADGEVFRLVEEGARAWHAGAGRWGAVADVNSRSIGIELVNRGDHPFAAAQMAALEGLLPGIMARWVVPAERVIGHSDMAPARKRDPGPRFDWARLARGGMAVWPAGGPSPLPDGRVSGFRGAAVAFGYDSGLSDDLLLAAFRLRFRPGAAGPLDVVDLAMAADLARRFPVDGGAGGA
jgi:N-acetylmuramoyl-L-alanine amidase